MNQSENQPGTNPAETAASQAGRDAVGADLTGAEGQRSADSAPPTRADAPKDYAPAYGEKIWPQSSSRHATGASNRNPDPDSRAGDLSSTAHSSSMSGRRSASTDVGDAIEQTRQQASRLMNDARDKGGSMIAEKKQMAADEIAGVANVLRKTAQNLHQENQITSGHYAERAAAGLDRLSTNLRDRDIGSLVRQTESFARRSPGLFFGGAVAAGFFISRFMKSSAQRDDSGGGDYGYAEAHDRSGGRIHDRGAWESRNAGVRTGYAEASNSSPSSRPSGGGASSGDKFGDAAHDTATPDEPIVPMPRSSDELLLNTDPEAPYGTDSRSLPHTDKRSGGTNAS